MCLEKTLKDSPATVIVLEGGFSVERNYFFRRKSRLEQCDRQQFSDGERCSEQGISWRILVSMHSRILHQPHHLVAISLFHSPSQAQPGLA